MQSPPKQLPPPRATGVFCVEGGTCQAWPTETELDTLLAKSPVLASAGFADYPHHPCRCRHGLGALPRPPVATLTRRLHLRPEERYPLPGHTVDLLKGWLEPGAHLRLEHVSPSLFMGTVPPPIISSPSALTRESPIWSGPSKPEFCPGMEGRKGKICRVPALKVCDI